MCVGCLITSALLVFTPADGLPPSSATPALAPTPTIALAARKQLAIAATLERLPDGPEMGVLREGLEDLRGKLSVTVDDAEARAVLTRELTALSDRVAADPHADAMFGALDAVIAQNETGSRSLCQQLRPPALSAQPLTLQSLTKQPLAPQLANGRACGWLGE